jgi:uncharacterized repeat protein (TIGR03803 family)
MAPTRTGGEWTETTLFNFTGGADGRDPTTGVIFDASGALYSTTCKGGSNNNGTVFRLSPRPMDGRGDIQLHQLRVSAWLGLA